MNGSRGCWSSPARRAGSQTIIGCMADSVLVTNLERQLVLWNTAAMTMLKFDGTRQIRPSFALLR